MRTFCIKKKHYEARDYTIKYLVVSLLLTRFAVQQISGQHPNVPTVTTPKSATMQQYGTFPIPSVPRPNMPQSSFPTGVSVQEQNTRMMHEDMQQMERQRQMANQTQMQEVFNELESKGLNTAACLTFVRPLDYSSQAGTEYFRNAFDGISKMLTGETTLSLKEATFLVENGIIPPASTVSDIKSITPNFVKTQIGSIRSVVIQGKTHYIIEPLYRRLK